MSIIVASCVSRSSSKNSANWFVPTMGSEGRISLWRKKTPTAPAQVTAYSMRMTISNQPPSERRTVSFKVEKKLDIEHQAGKWISDEFHAMAGPSGNSSGEDIGRQVCAP